MSRALAGWMAVAACALLGTQGTQAFAQEAGAPAAEAAPLKPDVAHGRAISYTCLGCHGIDGYRNAYPNYSVPKLKGQHPEYIVAALQEYRSGERAHITMHTLASTLSDQDMTDIAAYFAGQPLSASARPAGNVPQAAALCTSCHGADGVGIAPNYPTLAGQHPDYIARALHEYAKGGRKNAIMSGFAANLKAADVAAISQYFSAQRPALETEARPYTRFSASR